MTPIEASSIANLPAGPRPLLIVVMVSVSLPLLLMHAVAAEESCEPVLARVVSLQGGVEVQPAAASGWLPARLNDGLCLGDTIRVGAYARAALALANDSVLKLDQRTTLRLGGEVASGRSLIDLLFGDVHFFSHRPRALEISTPVASAGTEGTEFLLSARPERTAVVMLAGRVRLQTPAGELVVASGDAALARAGAAAVRETVARPRDAVAWALYYPPVLAPLAGGETPDALPAGLQSARARVAANDHAGALAALDQVPAAARDARWHTYRAGVLLGVGRVDEAEAALAAALAEDPAAAEALAQRAVLRVVQDRRAEGLADAREAVELSPDSAPARIALSYALQAGFALEEARAVLREAVARSPGDALAWARLAELEQSFGELDAAQTAAARAVALAPDLARTQMVLGFAALTRIDIDEAKAAFARAIELDSAEPFARLGLGLATIRQGDLEEGRRELEIAAALDPNNSLLRSYLGKAYFEERRGPLDAEQFRIAKQLDPNDPTPYFYDAIRLQTENRPVEALRELERSIALNDNRAVYRSRLLLDEDAATRGVSLARIYDDLGFDRVALVEATESLSQDPANWSAHRFLSDTYARLPRHEIARASELLQAQLLQPINVNPMQPSAPITDLNVIAGAGPVEAAFNEYTPLFERNRAQLTATGVVGNNATLGDELVASAVWNRLSVSAGQFHAETDGFRKNNDSQEDVYDAFAQVALTPKLNLQAEYRRRESDHGDLTLRFDPQAFEPERRDVDSDLIRLGTRFSPTPRANALLSVAYVDRDETLSLDSPNRFLDRANGYQIEGAFLHEVGIWATQIGGGYYDIDTNFRSEGFFPEVPDVGSDEVSLFWYNNLSLTDDLTAVLGVSYDDFQDGELTNREINPKLGFIWQIVPTLRLRAAYFEELKQLLAVNQTIETTNIVGFNQLVDDLNGTEADNIGVAIDWQIAPSLYSGFEFNYRNLKIAIIDPATTAASGFEKFQEHRYLSYLYWTPQDRWALTAAVEFEDFDRDEEIIPFGINNVETLMFPFTVRYFDPVGWFSTFGVTYAHQEVDRVDDIANLQGSDDFVILNASIGLRFPDRRGVVGFEVRNLLNDGFEFQDDNFRSSEIRRFPLVPERTFVARLTLNF